MKIALINENSQAAKNELICNTLKSVVEPMGHEVYNYGMYGAEDPKRGYTTVQGRVLHPKTEVTKGVLQQECEALMRDFFLRLR